jgi:cell division protein FtsN
MARWIGAAIGAALALWLVGHGWLIGHGDQRPPAPSSTADRPPPAARPEGDAAMRSAADAFPLILPAATTDVAVPAPPSERRATRAGPPSAQRSSPAQRPGTPVVPTEPAPPPRPRWAYIVQLGSYRHEEVARQDQARYRTLGIDARRSRSGTYTVLRLAPFDTLDAARTAADEVHGLGIDAVVLPPRRR